MNIKNVQLNGTGAFCNDSTVKPVLSGHFGSAMAQWQSAWCHCVVSLSKNIHPSLVLVQPRKTRPFITERLLVGRNESNQAKQLSGHSNTDKSKILLTIGRLMKVETFFTFIKRQSVLKTNFGVSF